jgi:quercetin dioxygenase-like cupin family protein
MQTVSTPNLDLLDIWFGDDPRARVRVQFPINKHTGPSETGVVYFEVAPGDHLATHTDSPEEVLYIISGTGIAHAGDESGRVSAGDVVVIPAMAPHGVANDGDETLRVVGFFRDATVVSTFEDVVQPLGLHQLEMGAPVPV